MSVAAAGTLTFDAAGNGAVYLFGLSNSPVELVIDIGVGGVPGVPYDQVVLQNAPALDVSNMTVRFFGGTFTGVTNWFLVANALAASTTFQYVVFDGGTTGAIVYAYSQNRIGAVVTPEPGALLLAALAVAGHARRRAPRRR